MKDGLFQVVERTDHNAHKLDLVGVIKWAPTLMKFFISF